VLNGLIQKITFPRVSLWLIGLMLVLPFLGYHHLLPIPSFYNEWIAAALGLAALALFLRDRHWQDMEFPVVALIPLGLVVVLLIQIPTDKIVFPEHNILGASYLLWATLLMMLARGVSRELGLAEVVDTLACFLLLGGILNAGIAVFQQFGINSFLDAVIIKKARVPFANLAQPNHFSDYIALALGSLLFLLAKRRLHIGTGVAVGCSLLYVLSFSGSRSSWLYVVAMAGLSLLFFLANRQAGNRRLLIAGLLLLPGFALIQFLAPISIQFLSPIANATPVITPTDNLFNLAGSKSDRIAIWLEAWQMFLQAPLLGVGFGEFVWHHFLFSEQAPAVIRGGLYNHAHNIVMQVLAELGLPAALLLVGGIFAWLVRFLKAAAYTLEEWWLLALSSVLAIHSMLEYPLWYTYFLGVAAILLGFGETRCFRLDMQRAGRNLFVLLFVLGGMSLFNLIHSYSGFEGAFYGMGKKLSKRSALDSIEENAKEYVSQVMLIHRESLLSSYAEIAVCRGIVLDKENLSGKLAVNGRAMHAAPINELVYRQAILLGLNGEHQAAAHQFDLAAAAYPKDAEAVVSVLKRKVVLDEAGFRPLLQHAEAWLQAHPEVAGKSVLTQEKEAVSASAARSP
jgi:O-antigen ligase